VALVVFAQINSGSQMIKFHKFMLMVNDYFMYG